MGFVSANQVTIGYTAASREDALHYLSEQAIELGFADDASAVEAAFIARENEAETGLVAGFAVPHAKSDAIHTPGVAVLKLTEPVEWPSFDGVPVDVALALYVPAGEAGTTHLRLLSKAAVMLMDAGFRDKVRASTDPVEIAELINSGLEDSDGHPVQSIDPSPRKRAATPYRCRGPVCVSPDKTCQNKPIPFWQANRELFHRNLGHG